MSKLLWGFLGLALIAAPAKADDKKTDVKKTDEKKVDEKKADDQPQPPRRGGRGQRGQGGAGGAFQFGRTPQPLLSDKDMEELKLSGDKKEKVSKIVKEYDAKAKEAREEMQKLFQGGQFDREKLQAARETSTKAREAAVSKIKAELNDDQKKKFDELQRERRAGGFGGFGGGIGGGFGGIRGGAFKAGQVLPPPAKERLELSEEQKKKIEELEKDVKAKLEKILSAEQLKKLEQAPMGGGRRPGADGARPGGRRPGGDGQPRRPRPDQQ